jgi:iron complex outermembrane receptor protein
MSGAFVLGSTAVRAEPEAELDVTPPVSDLGDEAADALVAAETLDGTTLDGESLDEEPPDEEEMIVRATRTPKPAMEIPAAVTVVELEQIQRARRQLSLGESLLSVPGVFTQNENNFAQDLRIAIRGFGARANFGIRGIKLIVDGIPATMPDGQGQVDPLQLATAGRIEVMRGPSASLYGSAAGGVVRIESQAPPAEPFVDGRVAFGSYGYRDYQARSAGTVGDVGYLIGVSRQKLEGYRDHARMENVLFNSKTTWSIDDASDLMAVLSFAHLPVAEDPGGLNETEVAEDRRQAAPNNLAYDAGESVDQLTSGLRYRRSFSEHFEIEAAGYAGFRDFQNRLPFDSGDPIDVGGESVPTNGGAVAFDRVFGGASLQQLFSTDVFGLGNRLMAGIDVELQRDDRVRRVNDFGTPTELTLDQAEAVTSVRVFVQDELDLLENLELTAAVGWDGLQYSVEDHFFDDGVDDSAERFFDEWSPMVGLRYSPTPAANLYARFSTSFEPPTTTELANADGSGGFNPDLEPQRALGYELGVKGMICERLRYELAGYFIRIENEFVRFEVAELPGRAFFRNANRSHRGGIELGYDWQIVGGLSHWLAYAYTVARFDEYDTNAGSFAGNLVPGVPDHHLSTGLRYDHDSGLYSEFDVSYVGAFFADDANTVESEPYVVGALRFGLDWRFGAWTVSPFVALDNLFDTLYIDNLRLNAGFGRYYEPAPEFTASGGIGLRYHF